MAKALEALEAGLDPEVEHEKGWVRAVRISGRRLRTLLKGLIPPGDPGRAKPLRDALRAELDALSQARDAEVIRKWFLREDVSWEPEERQVVDLAAPPAPPVAEAAGLRAEVAARLAPVVDALRSRIRAELPEELHRPLPRGCPGVVLGVPPEDRLPPWRSLRKVRPSPRARRAARVVLEGIAAPLEGLLPALAPEVPDTEDLHDLRRAARRLRYLLEALRVVIPGLDEVRAGVKHFQWLLGQVNDRRLVAETLDALDPPELTEESRRGVERARARLAAEEEALLAEARAELAGKASPEALARARRAVSSSGAAPA
jgi:CHAD domain-containing protein